MVCILCLDDTIVSTLFTNYKGHSRNEMEKINLNNIVHWYIIIFRKENSRQYKMQSFMWILNLSSLDGNHQNSLSINVLEHLYMDGVIIVK